MYVIAGRCFELLDFLAVLCVCVQARNTVCLCVKADNYIVVLNEKTTFRVRNKYCSPLFNIPKHLLGKNVLKAISMV